MAEQAQITSLEAVESFRARMIVYLSKARPALDETTGEVRRLKYWLEHEQLMFWEREMRKRHRAVDEAQQALFSARISNLNKDATSSLQMDLAKAKRAFDAAEGKHKAVKKWLRQYDQHVEPLVRQMDKLNTVLCHDIPLGIQHLTEMVKILAAYADIAAPGSAMPAPATDPTALSESDPGGNNAEPAPSNENPASGSDETKQPS